MSGVDSDADEKASDLSGECVGANDDDERKNTGANELAGDAVEPVVDTVDDDLSFSTVSDHNGDYGLDDLSPPPASLMAGSNSQPFTFSSCVMSVDSSVPVNALPLVRAAVVVLQMSESDLQTTFEPVFLRPFSPLCSTVSSDVGAPQPNLQQSSVVAIGPDSAPPPSLQTPAAASDSVDVAPSSLQQSSVEVSSTDSAPSLSLQQSSVESSSTDSVPQPNLLLSSVAPSSAPPLSLQQSSVEVSSTDSAPSLSLQQSSVESSSTDSVPQPNLLLSSVAPSSAPPLSLQQSSVESNSADSVPRPNLLLSSVAPSSTDSAPPLSLQQSSVGVSSAYSAPPLNLLLSSVAPSSTDSAPQLSLQQSSVEVSSADSAPSPNLLLSSVKASSADSAPPPSQSPAAASDSGDAPSPNLQQLSDNPKRGASTPPKLNLVEIITMSGSKKKKEAKTRSRSPRAPAGKVRNLAKASTASTTVLSSLPPLKATAGESVQLLEDGFFFDGVITSMRWNEDEPKQWQYTMNFTLKSLKKYQTYFYDEDDIRALPAEVELVYDRHSLFVNPQHCLKAKPDSFVSAALPNRPNSWFRIIANDHRLKLFIAECMRDELTTDVPYSAATKLISEKAYQALPINQLLTPQNSPKGSVPGTPSRSVRSTRPAGKAATARASPGGSETSSTGTPSRSARLTRPTDKAATARTSPGGSESSSTGTPAHSARSHVASEVLTKKKPKGKAAVTAATSPSGSEASLVGTPSHSARSRVASEAHVPKLKAAAVPTVAPTAAASAKGAVVAPKMTAKQKRDAEKTEKEQQKSSMMASSVAAGRQAALNAAVELGLPPATHDAVAQPSSLFSLVTAAPTRPVQDQQDEITSFGVNRFGSLQHLSVEVAKTLEPRLVQIRQSLSSTTETAIASSCQNGVIANFVQKSFTAQFEAAVTGETVMQLIRQVCDEVNVSSSEKLQNSFDERIGRSETNLKNEAFNIIASMLPAALKEVQTQLPNDVNKLVKGAIEDVVTELVARVKSALLAEVHQLVAQLVTESVEHHVTQAVAASIDRKVDERVGQEFDAIASLIDQKVEAAVALRLENLRKDVEAAVQRKVAVPRSAAAATAAAAPVAAAPVAAPIITAGCSTPGATYAQLTTPATASSGFAPPPATLTVLPQLPTVPYFGSNYPFNSPPQTQPMFTPATQQNMMASGYFSSQMPSLDQAFYAGGVPSQAPYSPNDHGLAATAAQSTLGTQQFAATPAPTQFAAVPAATQFAAAPAATSAAPISMAFGGLLSGAAAADTDDSEGANGEGDEESAEGLRRLADHVQYRTRQLVGNEPSTLYKRLSVVVSMSKLALTDVQLDAIIKCISSPSRAHDVAAGAKALIWLLAKFSIPWPVLMSVAESRKLTSNTKNVDTPFHFILQQTQPFRTILLIVFAYYEFGQYGHSRAIVQLKAAASHLKQSMTNARSRQPK